jgi:hypothetical protein
MLKIGGFNMYQRKNNFQILFPINLKSIYLISYYSILLGLSACTTADSQPKPINFPTAINETLYQDRAEKGRVSDAELTEASGLAVSRQIPQALWTHNDSGDEARVFLVKDDATVLNRFTLENAENVDWEEMAIALYPANNQPYIYIGDIGDNLKVRNIKTIYRFPEPNSANPANTLIPANQIDKISFQYPDGNHDAEAMWVDNNGDIYIITKSLTTEEAHVYYLAYPQSTNTTNIALKIATFPLIAVVAASLEIQTGDLLLKTYNSIYYWKRNLNKTIIETITEAIAWKSSLTGFYTLSEKQNNITPKLYFYAKK